MGRFLAALLMGTSLLISLGIPSGLLLLSPASALAGPGICTGPVCADGISRSAKHHWQLRLQVGDQRGNRERIVVDCRDGVISPRSGPVDRRYVAAVTLRVCRLAGEAD
jgi:hypothetical protein